jgi:adenine-specific DNA-methyltransferase
MKRLDADSQELKSADVVAENVERLKEIFPEAFAAEGTLDFDVLKQLLGGQIDEKEERYGLNWHGKRQARQLALTPSTGTLRPCPEESVDWDTTKNIFIEGDNLEVLKLLQKSYAGKVKLIYIDPPYNTGKDFVYPDNFQDNIKNYLELTGQVEGGQKISSNTEASGRFHTDWLNMMYPRIRLCRALLSSQGALFVSCDDSEVSNLRVLLDDAFGPENFVAQFVWKARQFADARAVTNVSTDHEYLLCYAKESGFALRGIERDESKFSNPDGDPRGPWMSRSLLGLATKEQRPNLHYDIVEPKTGRRFPPSPTSGWRYSKDKMAALIENGGIIFPPKPDGRPREKKFRCDMNSEFIAFRSVIEGIHTADGGEAVRALFGANVFSFPKPVELVRRIVAQVAAEGEIVLDCFAGSGTTGHAVMEEVAHDRADRRYILIQLPEPLDIAAADQKLAAELCVTLKRPLRLSELTKERLRRAAKRITESDEGIAVDHGFRVFKLASSNIEPWDPATSDVTGSMEKALDNVKPDRSADDLLYDVLLKTGLDLCVPIETKEIAKREVQSVGGGVLFTCFSDKKIKAADAEPLALGIVAWRNELAPANPKECRVVFRDSAFESDVAKSNLAAILKQHGFDDKLIASL